MYAQRVELGRFGGESAKPLTLYSNKMFISELPSYYTHKKAPRSQGICQHWVGDDGRIMVRGSHGLKGTQAYPRAFGQALALLYRRHECEIKADAQDHRQCVFR
jgi:hypothetical protein